MFSLKMFLGIQLFNAVIIGTSKGSCSDNRKIITGDVALWDGPAKNTCLVVTLSIQIDKTEQFLGKTRVSFFLLLAFPDFLKNSTTTVKKEKQNTSFLWKIYQIDNKVIHQGILIIHFIFT